MDERSDVSSTGIVEVHIYLFQRIVAGILETVFWILESFLAQFDADMHLTHERIPSKDRGRVAVIGSGPAGLTVAGDLARQGFNVEIFEMEPEPGGVLMFGIPEYRLPKEIVRREIKKIEELEK